MFIRKPEKTAELVWPQSPQESPDHVGHPSAEDVSSLVTQSLGLTTTMMTNGLPKGKRKMWICFEARNNSVLS